MNSNSFALFLVLMSVGCCNGQYYSNYYSNAYGPQRYYGYGQSNGYSGYAQPTTAYTGYSQPSGYSGGYGQSGYSGYSNGYGYPSYGSYYPQYSGYSGYSGMSDGSGYVSQSSDPFFGARSGYRMGSPAAAVWLLCSRCTRG